MIKNDVNDTLADEFLISMDSLLKDKEDFQENIDLVYKKYLGFDSNFLITMSFDDLEKFFVHNRIKDYSKLCVLGILFVQQWIEGQNKDASGFNKLIKGFKILSDVYLNDRDTKITYYKDYLLKASEILNEYQVPLEVKKIMVELYLKELFITKVDDLIFDILNDDASYGKEAQEIYKQILMLPNEKLEISGLTKEEIQESINEITTKYL